MIGRLQNRYVSCNVQTSRYIWPCASEQSVCKLIAKCIVDDNFFDRTVKYNKFKLPPEHGIS